MTWDPKPFMLAVVPQAADIDGLNHTNNAVYVQWCEKVDRAMAIRRGEYEYLLPSGEGDAMTLGTWLFSGDGRLAMERRFQLVRDRDGATILRGR
jgi:acyl-CoA thioester hydrolase